jgi:hypothetical protein
MDFSAFRSHRICSSIELAASSGRLAAPRRAGDPDLRLAALQIGHQALPAWVSKPMSSRIFCTWEWKLT